MMKEYITNLQETQDLAKTLAKAANPGDVFALKGDLGAGKTEFARAFIQALCGNIKVNSPTFTIVQEYPNNLYHFDLYRIKHESELPEIGFEEMLENGICLIEWPQIGENYLQNYLEINLEILDENRRKITICPKSKQ